MTEMDAAVNLFKFVSAVLGLTGGCCWLVSGFDADPRSKFFSIITASACFSGTILVLWTR